MGIGSRIFVIEGHDISTLSRKQFDAFFHKKTAAIPRYASQNITIAAAIYSTDSRKPKQIMQIDVFRIKVADDGRIDEDNLAQYMHLAANNLWPKPAKRTVHATGTVLDAHTLFDERWWKQANPDISGPALKAILANLFG